MAKQFCSKCYTYNQDGEMTEIGLGSNVFLCETCWENS